MGLHRTKALRLPGYDVADDKDKNLKDCVSAAEGEVRCARERERVWASLAPPPSLSPFPLYNSPPSPPPSLPISLLTRRRLSCPAAGGRGAGGAAQGGVGVGSGAGPGGGLRLGEARHQVDP